MFDRRCELLYLAEKLDLWRIAHRVEDAPLPLDEWWRDGALNVDLGAARELVADIPQDEEAGVTA